MTIFPIHIIELLTVALVLLVAYRIFQAQTAEAKSQFYLSHQEESVHRSSNKPDAVAQAEQNESQQMLESHGDPSEKKSVCHQTVLNNYIGDFF